MIALKKTLILECKPEGAIAANYLAKRLERAEAEITLIDKTEYHLYPPSLLWILTGARKVDDIMGPLGLLETKSVKVVIDEVTGILSEESAVETTNGGYEYDYPVVALGGAFQDLLVRKANLVKLGGDPWCRVSLAWITSSRC